MYHLDNNDLIGATITAINNNNNDNYNNYLFYSGVSRALMGNFVSNRVPMIC
jgi:hypothetical protein